MAAPKAAIDLAGPNDMGLLEIPVLRVIAIKEYGKWLASPVEDNSLKAAFRQACEITLPDSFSLEHIYKDQGPEFFVIKRIKPGIAGSFVEDIRDWVENVKTIPVYEVQTEAKPASQPPIH